MPNAAFRTKEYDRANQDGNRSGQRVNQASEVVDHVFLPNSVIIPYPVKYERGTGILGVAD